MMYCRYKYVSQYSLESSFEGTENNEGNIPHN